MNYKLLVDITDYIILYPIRWYNFIKRVITSSTRYKNILIVSKKNINDERTFNEIFKILSENKVIVETSENIDFLIYYFKDNKHSNIFSNWLNLITLRAAVDLFKEVKCEDPLLDNFIIIYRNKNIFVSDNYSDINSVYITLNKSSNNNVITYTYSYFSFKNDLEKKLLSIGVDKKID